MLACHDPVSDTYIDLESYGSKEAMQRAFAQYAPVNNAQMPGCLAGQSVGKYTVDGQRRGRVSCYVSGDDPTVVWTLDSDLVIGYAFTPDDDLPGLYDWWRSIDSSAVPVVTPRAPAPPTPRPTAAPTP